MWPSGLTLAMSLTLNFQGQIWYLLYLLQKLSDFKWNENQTYTQLKSSNVSIGLDLGHDLEGQGHYSDVIMGAMASQITSLTIVYSAVYQAQIKENIKAPHH